MQDLIAARIPGRPLPGPLYTSQQAFDLDLDAIFGPRAFRNVCRHRGARLLTERSGSVRGSIVCGYHRWTYGTDGTLRHAESQPASFDKTAGASSRWRTTGSATTATGTVPSSRLGHLSLHVQPNSWFHFLSDHAVTFAVLPVAPDRTLLRTTNEQDAVLAARAHRGVSDPGYEPGPYAPNEGQVEAFVAWYTGRLRASR
jgi:phenylpropionate dioxygenase-like ring-hydroxylating dioxygenase large terminal subunit